MQILLSLLPVLTGIFLSALLVYTGLSFCEDAYPIKNKEDLNIKKAKLKKIQLKKMNS